MSNDDDAVILNNIADNGAPNTGSQDSEKSDSNESTETEEIVQCTECQYSNVMSDENRFVGDSCPECLSGYIEQK